MFAVGAGDWRDDEVGAPRPGIGQPRNHPVARGLDVEFPAGLAGPDREAGQVGLGRRRGPVIATGDIGQPTVERVAIQREAQGHLGRFQRPIDDLAEEDECQARHAVVLLGLTEHRRHVKLEADGLRPQDDALPGIEDRHRLAEGLIERRGDLFRLRAVVGAAGQAHARWHGADGVAEPNGARGQQDGAHDQQHQEHQKDRTHITGLLGRYSHSIVAGGLELTS